MDTFAYAGIGSRETPQHVLALMEQIGYAMAQRGHTLRSGAAPGADTAFEIGCAAGGGPKEIFIPWPGFQGRTGRASNVIAGVSPAAEHLASQFHPNWGACSPGARALHARNCYQVLGLNLDAPAARVICWTPRAQGGGGTGQAIRIARYFSIPVHDLADPRLFKAYADELENLS